MHFDRSCHVEVSANGKSCTTNLMVYTADMPPIIGRDLINALELGVQGSPTVHVRDTKGQLHELKGDIDMGSYCSIIQRPWFKTVL